MSAPRSYSPVPTVYAEAPRPFVGAGHWPARHIEDGKAARPGAAPYRGEFPLWRAATWGRPYVRNQTGSVGSAKPGVLLEPHQF